MEVYLLQSKKISALEQRENFAGELKNSVATISVQYSSKRVLSNWIVFQA